MLNVLSKHRWKLNCRCDLTDVSRAKILHRDKIGLHSGFTLQPFMSWARQNFGAGLQRYNSPVDWARKLFKPSTDSANLLVEIEKKFYVLGLGFFGGDVTGGGVFTFFGLIYEALDANPMSEFFRSSFFRKWTIIRFLEPLIDFLANLEPKLCHKNQRVVKFSTLTKGNLGWITLSLYMAITRHQNSLESWSNPLKTREDLHIRLQKKVHCGLFLFLAMFT